MALALTTISQLTKSILDALKTLGAHRAKQRELVDEALTAIRKAVTRTDAYIKARHANKPADPEREAELSELWHLAAIPLQHFDEDLARRCNLKGTYWSNPDEWPSDLVNEARIGLSLIDKQAEHLLKLGIKPKR